RTEEPTDSWYYPERALVPAGPARDGGAETRAALPARPAARRDRLATELGASPADMQAMANAGVTDLVAETAAAGAPAGEARKWWLGYLAQLANAAEVEPAELRIEPAQVAEVIALVADGTLSDGLARQGVDAVLETGQQPAAIVAERGLRRVSDADTLGAAVDEAIAAQPDVVAKIRGGKVQAVGPLVGAVMRATRGQADAALVRKLVLARL